MISNICYGIGENQWLQGNDSCQRSERNRFLSTALDRLQTVITKKQCSVGFTFLFQHTFQHSEHDLLHLGSEM